MNFITSEYATTDQINKLIECYKQDLALQANAQNLEAIRIKQAEESLALKREELELEKKKEERLQAKASK